jgi:hypothetical protein
MLNLVVCKVTARLRKVKKRPVRLRIVNTRNITKYTTSIGGKYLDYGLLECDAVQLVRQPFSLTFRMKALPICLRLLKFSLKMVEERNFAETRIHKE